MHILSCQSLHRRSCLDFSSSTTRRRKRTFFEISTYVHTYLLGVSSVAAPVAEGEEGAKEVATAPAPVDLTAAISTIAQEGKVFSESKLPPSYPTSFKRWKVEQAEDAPHDPHSYFPMLLVK